MIDINKKLSPEESFKYGRWRVGKQKIVLYYFKKLGFEIFLEEFKRLYEDEKIGDKDLEAIRDALKKESKDDRRA